MKRPCLIVLLAFVLLVTGCGPKTKPILIKTDFTLYQSVKAISDVEIVLAQAGKLTPAQSLRINQALLPAAKLGLEATKAIEAWQPGQMAPESMQRLVWALGDVTKVIIDIVADPGSKAALLEKVALSQQAAMIILSVTGAIR